MESLTSSLQEEMMEFKLSYEMWRVGEWAVTVTNVSHIIYIYICHLPHPSVEVDQWRYCLDGESFSAQQWWCWSSVLQVFKHNVYSLATLQSIVNFFHCKFVDQFLTTGMVYFLVWWRIHSSDIEKKKAKQNSNTAVPYTVVPFRHPITKYLLGSSHMDC